MFRYWNDGTPEAFDFSTILVMLLAEAMQGGADVNELLAVASGIRAGNREDWQAAFARRGDRAPAVADGARAEGHEATASEAFFHAFTYFRTAESALPAQDARKLSLYRQAIACFERGLAASRHPFEAVSIAYEGHRLAGYFFPPEARAAAGPAPCVIFLSGADALPEENFFRGVRVITARGAACLVFNGPGQGSTIRLLGLPTVADYERPVAAALDYLATRADIDHDQIGLLGVSMAGYYALRAVAFEHRIAACVAWGALYSVCDDIYAHYPPLRGQLRWIAGAEDDAQARAIYAAFSLEGVLGQVRCPVLITHGVRDRMVPVASARRAYEELEVADKELRLYDEAEGGAEHISVDNWAEVLPYQVDWLLDRLRSA